MALRIKICGITREEDAWAAVDAGADALGFVFVPGTPRFIKPERAASITRHLPPFVSCVGLFVNADPALIRAAVTEARLDTVDTSHIPPLDHVIAVFGRSSAGIDFEALDNAPVHFIVLFIVPRKDYHMHLQTLAAIAMTSVSGRGGAQRFSLSRTRALAISSDARDRVGSSGTLVTSSPRREGQGWRPRACRGPPRS